MSRRSRSAIEPASPATHPANDCRKRDTSKRSGYIEKAGRVRDVTLQRGGVKQRDRELAEQERNVRVTGGRCRAGALILVAGLIGCGGGKSSQGGPAGSTTASAPALPTASPSADASTAPLAPSGEPAASGSSSAAPATASSQLPPSDLGPPNAAAVGNGASEFAPIDGCKSQTVTAAEYLQRGELTIAGRPNQIGLAWLVQLKGRAQIGFGGFDGDARQVARPRGVASARENAPHLFATGDDWTLAWFDDEGLAYARPKYALQQKIEVDHLSSVRDVPPEDLALTAAPDGSLLAASTFGAGGQLSLFLFAPVDTTQPKARALGLTKTAKGPRKPAALADGAGYTMAWLETDGSIAATRLNPEGREAHPATTIVSGVGDRTGLTMTPVKDGALLVWTESGEIRARALDGNAMPKSPTWRVGKGTWATTVSRNDGALVAWVGSTGTDEQLVAMQVGPNGPAKKALKITSTKPEAPGVVAVVGDRVAFAWPEKMSATITSYRAVLRTLDGRCFDAP